MDRKNNMDFDLFLRCLTDCAEVMDETCFIFLDDEPRGECILGYLSFITTIDFDHTEQKQRVDRPYWLGTGCDLEGGATFLTAEDMLDAKVYGNRSIKSAWDHVFIISLGPHSLDEWFSACCSFGQEVIEEDGYWRLCHCSMPG